MLHLEPLGQQSDGRLDHVRLRPTHLLLSLCHHPPVRLNLCALKRTASFTLSICPYPTISAPVLARARNTVANCIADELRNCHTTLGSMYIKSRLHFSRHVEVETNWLLSLD